MNSMLILVEVSDFRCRAAIGWYPEERIIKTDLLITVQLKYRVDEINDELGNVIDYQEINNLLHALTKKEYKLLETLGEELINTSFEKFNGYAIYEISVEIVKPQIFNKNSDTKSHKVFLSKTF